MPTQSRSGSWLLKKLLQRPEPALIEQGLQDAAGRVRELAVLAIPSGQERRYLKRLKPLLQDADPGVQVAVCSKLAGDSAILPLLRSTPNEWVLRAAASACTARHRWQCAQILGERLVEKERWLTVYQFSPP